MSIEPTQEQAAALASIKSFLLDDAADAFILRGSAGTGKTTLLAKLIEILDELHLSCALLAPTGRAARILGGKIRSLTQSPSHPSSTIHKLIYSFTALEVNEEAENPNDPGFRMIFPLKKEEPSHALFIIDESSMVGDKKNYGDTIQFGSGKLLADLITYARTGRPGRPHDPLTKLLFVGDPAQLPPVGENSSPALSEEYLQEKFDLKVKTFDLTQVMRQAQGSAILDRATALREAILLGNFNKFALHPNGTDITQIDSTGAADLIVQYLHSKSATVAVVQTNATALDYNRSIRQRLWGDPEKIVQIGDTLLVNRNSTTHLLSNGDLVKIWKASPDGEHVPIFLRGGHSVDLWFRRVTVVYRDSDGAVIETDCLILENLLNSPERELSALEHRALLVHFRKRHPDLKLGSDDFRKAIRTDPYFNALQVKYGYAMTCHKAQGGEWSTAIVDFNTSGGIRNAAFFRWAYTAITRAAKQLVVINPPAFTATSGIDWEGLTTASPTAIHTALQDTEELASDPDWQRLSFSKNIAPLMAVHQKLRSVWAAEDISIESLQHLQYCERYVLRRANKRTSINYYYNSKFQITRSAPVPGAMWDTLLADNALAAIRALNNTSEGDTSDFIQDFLDSLDRALASSGIRRLSHRAMPYRLRIKFIDESREAEIDFSYNGSSVWTKAQEVGAPGNSRGLYEQVQELMANQAEEYR